MKKLLLILAATATLFCACRKEASFEPQADSSRLVRFSTYMGEYSFKAIDVIEAGENIGVFAGAPINVDNQSLAVAAGNTITSSDAIQWTSEQVSKNFPNDFYAYYPYNDQLASTSFTFEVKDNQGSEADYKASDLMIAKALGVAPKTVATLDAPDNTVSLTFNHALSKVTLNITSADLAIKTVTIQGVKKSASVDLTDASTLAATGNNANIVAHKVSGPNASNVSVYSAIIVPQSASPTIVVTTFIGYTYTFTINSAYTFEAGKNASADLVVNYNGSAASPTSVGFASFTPAAWTNGDNAEFGSGAVGNNGSQANKWSLIGQLYSTSWNKDFYMNYDETAGQWELKGVKIEKNAEFKFRYNNAWAPDGQEFGSNTADAHTVGDGTAVITNGNNNIKLSDDTQLYDIYLKPAEGAYIVKHAE